MASAGATTALTSTRRCRRPSGGQGRGRRYVIGLGHPASTSSPLPLDEQGKSLPTPPALTPFHGHSSTPPSPETIKDKSGKEVVFEQTGTKLANVGKIIIKADGTISHENVDLNTVEPDAEAAAYIQTITDKFDALQKQVVAKTSVGADHQRRGRPTRVRNAGPTSAICARTPTASCWALTSPSSTAAAWRDNIKVGDITYGDIIKVHPFGNGAPLGSPVSRSGRSGLGSAALSGGERAASCGFRHEPTPSNADIPQLRGEER